MLVPGYQRTDPKVQNRMCHFHKDIEMRQHRSNMISEAWYFLEIDAQSSILHPKGETYMIRNLGVQHEKEDNPPQNYCRDSFLWWFGPANVCMNCDHLAAGVSYRMLDKVDDSNHLKHLWYPFLAWNTFHDATRAALVYLIFTPIFTSHRLFNILLTDLLIRSLYATSIGKFVYIRTTDIQLNNEQ